jgi:hypothetical protein
VSLDSAVAAAELARYNAVLAQSYSPGSAEKAQLAAANAVKASEEAQTNAN